MPAAISSVTTAARAASPGRSCDVGATTPTLDPAVLDCLFVEAGEAVDRLGGSFVMTLETVRFNATRIWGPGSWQNRQLPTRVLDPRPEYLDLSAAPEDPEVRFRDNAHLSY